MPRAAALLAARGTRIPGADMSREKFQSYPLLDSRDEPRAISQADFNAHLLAHRDLDERIRLFEGHLVAHEWQRSDSSPVTLEKTSSGLVVKGNGRYIVWLALIAMLAFVAWLYLH